MTRILIKLHLRTRCYNVLHLDSPVARATSTSVVASLSKSLALVATQTYFPESCIFTSVTTSAPLICWLRPTGSAAPRLLQVMTGCGSPVALQFNVKVSPMTATSFAGGLTVNCGRETTTRRVLFITLPKRFLAVQR